MKLVIIFARFSYVTTSTTSKVIILLVRSYRLFSHHFHLFIAPHLCMSVHSCRRPRKKTRTQGNEKIFANTLHNGKISSFRLLRCDMFYADHNHRASHNRRHNTFGHCPLDKNPREAERAGGRSYENKWHHYIAHYLHSSLGRTNDNTVRERSRFEAIMEHQPYEKKTSLCLSSPSSFPHIRHTESRWRMRITVCMCSENHRIHIVLICAC